MRRISSVIKTIKDESLPVKIAAGTVVATGYALYVVIAAEIAQRLGLNSV